MTTSESAKADVVDEPLTKKARGRGKRQGKELGPLKIGDTYSSASEGKATEMPGTLKGRNGVLKKWNVHFGTNFGSVRELDAADINCFSDENLSLFLLNIGESMGHGKSAFKTVNAALNNWLIRRNKPKYSEPSNQHHYPQVIEALKVSSNFFVVI